MRSAKKTQRGKRPKKKRQENIMAEENKTTTQDSGAIPAAAQDKFESSKTHVRKAAEDLKSAAGVMADDLKSAATEMAGEYRDKAEQVWGDARDRARTLPGRWRAVRAGKSNQGGLYRARNWICSRADFPSLTIGPNGWRHDAVPQSRGTRRLAP